MPTQAAFETLFLEKKRQRLDGFSMSAWTGHEEGLGGAASFFCGASSRRVPGNSLVYLPFEGANAERLLTTSMVTRLMDLMVRAWEPDAGVFMSNAHLRALGDGADADVQVGWVTYLSRRRGPVPPLPSPMRVEAVEDLGSLVILTPERFTVSNSEHVALAAHARTLLEGAGLLHPFEPMAPPGN